MHVISHLLRTPLLVITMLDLRNAFVLLKRFKLCTAQSVLVSVDALYSSGPPIDRVNRGCTAGGRRVAARQVRDVTRLVLVDTLYSSGSLIDRVNLNCTVGGRSVASW